VITRDDVKSVAALARLEFDDDQLDRMTAELGGILEHIAKLSELQTEHISPTSQILDLRNVLRQDNVRPSLPTEAILANAPDREENCFRVRAVLE
jgi:aspartyl-tRNA(Asn)/glutamyl-tRNA(Gln) amidotransferase subunit C